MGTPSLISPHPLEGTEGDNSVFSPSHSPEGERGEDTIRMDKVPLLGGGWGEFFHFLERYSSRMMVALILSTNALSCLAFLEIPLSSMARWAMTDVKRSSKSSM